MLSRAARLCWIWVCLIALGAAPIAAQAQAVARQPLDVMLVIDNSCSMFPAEQRVPGCEVWGNDPGFLRVTGASLFIARTGFAQANAGDYQLGVISMGDDPPELISPLAPLAQARDALARTISNPTPKLATQLMPALRMAYAELKDSPRRRPGNLPAVVLLTDGAPFPAQGQSDADIEALVAQYPDVPLFVILLQNTDRPIAGYDRYVEFWRGMQTRHSSVQAYPVTSTSEIERTYSQIVARLENAVARPTVTLAPGETLEVFVSRYVQRLVLTVTRERGRPPANVTVTDPAGRTVGDGDAGVERFRGADNPVEVLAIGRARLDQAPRDAVWKITSDAPVSVHLDMDGAYQIEFVAPPVSFTALPGQFLANARQSPARPLEVRLRLVDGQSGAAVTEPQPLSVRVTNPDGSTAEVPLPAQGLRPAADGAYSFTVDLARGYPGALDNPGRYVFTVEAGRIADQAGAVYPIARAGLLVDAGRGAYIAGVAPETALCVAGQAAGELAVTVGDLEPGADGRLRAFAGGSEIELARGADGAFRGSIEPLCGALLATMSCGAEVDTALRLRLEVSGGGTAGGPLDRDVPVRVTGLACTPTPTPTATFTPQPTTTPTPAPTPTPVPTPIPDGDGDGANDQVDLCPDDAQWGFLARWDGCPPPLPLQVAGGLAGLGMAAFLAFYAAPLALVMTVQPPPAGYVQVYRGGKAEGSYRSLRSLGQSARRRVVTIGSQGMLRVPGLDPVELRVERRGPTGVVLRGARGPQLFLIREIAGTYTAANGAVVLKFSTDPRQLR